MSRLLGFVFGVFPRARGSPKTQMAGARAQVRMVFIWIHLEDAMAPSWRKLGGPIALALGSFCAAWTGLRSPLEDHTVTGLGYRRHSLEVLSGSLRVSLPFMFGCKSVHEVADSHHQTLFHPSFATWLSSGWNSEASWNSAGTAKMLLPASKMYTGSKLGTAEQWNSEVAGFFSLAVKINLVYHVGDIK